MVDLSPLICRTPDCPAPHQLRPVGESRLLCGGCGQSHHAVDLIRPYAKLTGSWIIGAGVAFSWGWSQSEGQSRWIALGVAGAVLAYGVYRIVWQKRALKALAAPAEGGAT